MHSHVSLALAYEVTAGKEGNGKNRQHGTNGKIEISKIWMLFVEELRQENKNRKKNNSKPWHADKSSG